MSDPRPSLTGLSSVKLALMARQARERSEQVLRADPIAIVGMGCRVPGGGDTPEKFWQLLSAGVDATREVPADRWDGAAWLDPDVSAIGKSITKRGGFLERIDGFDAAYFGILPREAERMDPQQRLFLEVAVEALDDAGLTRERLRGSRTGVFVASYHNDYSQMQYGDVDAIDARTLTGTLHSVLANRLSYFLDLHGPSLSIDTACSSSLVAIHLACQSLRYGESDVAVAGGVSLIVAPELMVSMSKVGFMAPDGRCKTFDAQADGFARGEGCGLVVLKRLSDALAEGDRVLAVVRGSAVNQDGRSTLLAAPHGPAQEALIREALANSQLAPERIGFIEAHGTGTALGDPIEVEAIATTVGRVSGAGPCLLGSAKANLGHLEAAAGVVGLIKAVLALEHEAVPPQVHFRSLNPHISLSGTRLAISAALAPWPKGTTPRCAGISSFGVGGTNAHVIIEEAPELPATQAAPDSPVQVLTLSAQTSGGLTDLARSWLELLAKSTARLEDLCSTAAQRRTHYSYRFAVTGRSKEEMAARLRDYLAGASAPGLINMRRAADSPRVAFVFSGQGPQWYAMGRELLAAEPVFRDVMTECDGLLRPLSGWSLLDELAKSEERSRLSETEVAQPALFSLQVALAALWKSWGIEPAAVVGHSIGEIAALHVAGALDLPTAVRVVWHRGRIMQQATGLGRMASVSLTESEAQELVRPHAGKLSIGAINAPRTLVLSGDAAILQGVLADLGRREVGHRMLPVQYAFHSAQMEPFRALLAAELANVRSSPTAIPFYSTVTGARLTEQTPIDAAYFGRNVREPVRFAAAIGLMASDGCDVFLEIGPHPVLGSAIAECVADVGNAPAIVTSLRRGRPESESMLQACASLHVAGAQVDWPALQIPGAVVSLPSYPWQRQRFWLRKRPALSAPATSKIGHPLLGSQLSAAGLDCRIYEGRFDVALHAWLEDHRIFERVPLPAAAVLEMFTAAAARNLSAEEVQIQDFVMHAPLFLPDAEPSDGTRWQVSVSKPQEGRVELRLFEAVPAEGGGELTWRAVASASAVAAPSAITALSEATGRAVALPEEQFYSRFAALGVAFGPAFQTLSAIERADGHATAWIELPQSLAAMTSGYAVHPVLIDAALQLCSAAASPDADGEVPARVFLPLGADRVTIRRSDATRLRGRAVVESGAAGESLSAKVILETERGERVVTLDGMRFARAVPAAFAAAGRDAGLELEVEWQRKDEVRSAAPIDARGTWLLFADKSGIAAQIASRISAAGGHCLLVEPGEQFARLRDDVWTVDPREANHFARLLAETGWATAGQRRAILHCWPVDTSTFDSDSEGSGDDLLATGSTLHLLQALTALAAGAPTPVWLITQGVQVVARNEPATRLKPRSAGCWGLASVAAIEYPELPLHTLDIDPSASLDVDQVLAEFLNAAGTRIALRGAQRFTPTLRRRRPRAAAARGASYRARVARPGTLEGVEVVDAPSTRVTLLPNEVRLRVLAAGLNFRDVLLTLGMYEGKGAPPLGAECAGEVIEIGTAVTRFKAGDRVFGYVGGSFASEVTVPAEFLARLPAAINTEEGAGIAIAFLTAFYGLHSLAGLKRGERVLIHAAAGGVGLAAVQLAQRCGAEVFATAGSSEKRAYLRSLGVKHVMDSRTLEFSEQVLALTNGEGVHVALNSLAGEFIPATLRVLGREGRFLELGKRDVWTPEAMAAARPDVRYRVYDLGSDAEADRSLLRPMLEELLAAFADGSLRPLPVRVFALDEIREAMRYMAQARHIGKVVLRIASEAPQALQIKSAATYLITGGLGALGLETARWLAARGARHLVLVGRNAPGAAALQVVRELEASGANVRCLAADVSDPLSASTVLREARSAGVPLRGIVHAAGELRDGVLARQRWADAEAVLKGKARGAWNLHRLTREDPLDFFVLYSAAGALLGASGQGLYAAANLQLDALAQARRRAGLPALSVAWGAWAGAGMAAKAAAQGDDVWAARGVRKLPAADALRALDRLLDDGATNAVVVAIDWARFLARLPSGAEKDFFAEFAEPASARVAPEARQQGLVEELRALPAGERRDTLMKRLSERILQVLGLDPATRIDPRAALKDIGLDSLMAVELRNALNRSAPKPLPATLLFDYPTLDALTNYLGKLWGIVTMPPPVPALAGAIASRDASLDDVSDSEAEALLLAELEELRTGRAP